MDLPERENTKGRWPSLGLAAAGLLLGGVLLGPAPARAGDYFARGFEDELGRLVAREIIHLGHFVLGGGYAYGAQPVVVQPVPYPVYTPPPRHYPPRHRPAPRYYDDDDCDDDHVVYERYERRRKPRHYRGGYRY